MADFGYAHFGEDDENEEEEGHGVRIKDMETCRCQNILTNEPEQHFRRIFFLFD